MQREDLIKHFSGKLTLPVDVNEVVGVLRDDGIEHKIEFIGVDLDISILQGKIKIFYIREGVYADPKPYANIYYHSGHEPDWQRFVCCKELMHLLDPIGAQTTSMEEIDELASKIGLPPEMQDPMADGFATNVDRVAEFRAAAVLLPFASRDALLPALTAGILTLSDIARMADIPRKYVALVMSPGWADVHKILVGQPML
jgi:hypothetical protein